MKNKKKTILLVGTCDSKGDEILFMKDIIESKGHRCLVLDMGLRKDPANFTPDITRKMLSKMVDRDLDELIAAAEAGRYEVAVEELGRGALMMVEQLNERKEIDGVLGIGGSMGAALTLKIFRALPVGFPKVLICTVALSEYLHPYSIKSDITLIQPIVDFWGINQWVKRDLQRAAQTISVMVEHDEPLETGKWIAMTAIGWVHSCVPLIKKSLEEKGYKIAVSHSVSMQGAILERLIKEKVIKGMIDLCPFEILHDIAGAACSSKDRMEAAATMGIPTIVAPGAMGVISMYTGHMARFEAQGRFTIQHNEILGTAQAKTEEIAESARIIASRLNKATGKVAFIIPTRGFQTYDKEGKMYYDPEGRKVFIEIIKKNLQPQIDLELLDCHWDDSEFGQRILEKSLEYFKDIVW